LVHVEFDCGGKEKNIFGFWLLVFGFWLDPVTQKTIVQGQLRSETRAVQA